MRYPSVFVTGKRLRFFPGLLLGVLVLLGAGDDSARVEQLGHQIMCVCGCNQILLECNHVGCSYSSRMRKELVAGVDAGQSDNNILQSFIQDYGTTVLATPTHSGFDRVAWIMPYLALVVGITLVILVIRTWRKRPLVVHASVPAPLRDEELEPFRKQAHQETDL